MAGNSQGFRALTAKPGCGAPAQQGVEQSRNHRHQDAVSGCQQRSQQQAQHRNDGQRHCGLAQRGGTVNAGVQVPILLTLLVAAVLYPVNVEGFRAELRQVRVEEADRADLRIQRAVEEGEHNDGRAVLVLKVVAASFLSYFLPEASIFFSF